MKRKCGTCKYFQDKGVANSGTCQHFKRQALRDVVLVRQSELACRNTWDQDLWEPRFELANESSGGVEVDEVIDTHTIGTWSPGTIHGGSEDVPLLSPLGEDSDKLTAVGVPMFTGTTERPGLNPVASTTTPAAEVKHPANVNRTPIWPESINTPRPAPSSVSGASAPASPGVWSADSVDPASGAGRPPRHHETSAHQPTEPLPTDEVRSATGDFGHWPGSDEPFVHVDGAVYGPPSVRKELPVIQPIGFAESSDPIDRSAHLRGIKRCCGTCRDFRQLGDGMRGQCVNPYAFSERRMVQSDQLACRSSLGMWWMPSDDVWLEKADTSHHGRPTPLLDAALRQGRAGERGRDSSPW